MVFRAEFPGHAKIFIHYILPSSAHGEGSAKPLSWNLVAVVTTNSILSLAQSAGSACASEVEAVPSGATVGPDRH